MNLPDIDIDLADREQLLKHLQGTPARLTDGRKHNTGVYFTDIPVASDGLATVDYKHAEELGYFKLDLLNVSVYDLVKDEQHLQDMMQRETPWHRVWEDREFCEKIVHIGNYFDLLGQMKPDTIPRMAMFLSVIRPAKSHLRGKPWKEIAETVWVKPDDNAYYFKKSHAVSYAHLVALHINLLHFLD